MKLYNPTTVQGYSLFEVASAFQKSVRRGLEEDAIYWAVELHLSNYDEYLWKRIRIICSEDIGLAEPHLPATIRALYDNYTDLKKKKDEKHAPERLFLTHAVLLLCRAQKSRIVDHALLWAWGSHYEIPKKAIPEFAYDKHTPQGKKLGRGWTHFFTEGTLLSPMADLPKEAEYKALAQQYAPNPIPQQPEDEDSQLSIF